MNEENHQDSQGNIQGGYSSDSGQPGFYEQPEYNSRPGYNGQPVYNNRQTAPEAGPTAPMSVKDWLLTLLVLCVPCVGIVMTFVWAFGSNGNLNRKNYAKAMLVIWAVILVLYLLIFIIAGVSAASIISGMGGSY